MQLPINATNLTLVVKLEQPDKTPILGVTHNTAGFSIFVLKYGSTVFTELNLVEGTVGSFVSNSWKEIGGGRYQFCPANSVLSGNGYPTWIYVATEGNPPIEGRIDPCGFPSGNNTILTTMLQKLTVLETGSSGSSPQFVFNIPGIAPVAASTGSPIYIKEKGRTIQFTANRDLTDYDVQIIIEVNGVDFAILDSTTPNFVKSGNTITYIIPDEWTEEVRTYVWAIRNKTNLHFYGQGSFAITFAPFEDPPPE